MSATAYSPFDYAPSPSAEVRPAFAAPAVNRKLYMLADAAVPISVLVCSFLVHNSWLLSIGLTQFLGLSFSLKNVLLLGLTILSWWGVFSAFGLYSDKKIRSRSFETTAVVLACSVCSGISLFLWPVVLSHNHSLKSTLILWSSTLVAASTVRYSLRLYHMEISPRLMEERNILIVGTGPRAQQLYGDVLGHRSWRVLGFVDSTDANGCPPSVRPLFLGRLESLEKILMLQVVDEVLIALPIRSCHNQIQEVIAVCEKVGVEVRYFAHEFKSHLARPQYEHTAETSAVVLKMVPHNAGCQIVKRTMDILGAIAGLLLFSPLFLLAAVAIALTSPGATFFAQERYGLNRRRFKMLKFRTMCANAENLQSSVEHMNEASGPVFKIRDDPRVTPVGRLLRKTSIDELPQLCNVLRGEMSLVGPRPMSIRDVSRFSEARLMRRFSVKPGITGLWQVSGRSNIGFDHWIELDLRYIDRWSLGLDFQILLRTLPAVVRGTGAL